MSSVVCYDSWNRGTKVRAGMLHIVETPLYRRMELMPAGCSRIIDNGIEYVRRGVEEAPDPMVMHPALWPRELTSENDPVIIGVTVLRKIPENIIAETRRILQVIYDEHRTEGNVLIGFSEIEDRFYCHVPKQQVSAASVFTQAFDIDEIYRRGHHIAATFHSHPFGGTGAFLSGTDHHHSENIPGVPIASFNFSTTPVTGNLYKFGAMECEFHKIPMLQEDLAEIPELVDISPEERARIKELIKDRITGGRTLFQLGPKWEDDNEVYGYDSWDKSRKPVANPGAPVKGFGTGRTALPKGKKRGRSKSARDKLAFITDPGDVLPLPGELIGLIPPGTGEQDLNTEKLEDFMRNERPEILSWSDRLSDYLDANEINVDDFKTELNIALTSVETVYEALTADISRNGNMHKPAEMHYRKLILAMSDFLGVHEASITAVNFLNITEFKILTRLLYSMFSLMAHDIKSAPALPFGDKAQAVTPPSLTERFLSDIMVLEGIEAEAVKQSAANGFLEMACTVILTILSDDPDSPEGAPGQAVIAGRLLCSPGMSYALNRAEMLYEESTGDYLYNNQDEDEADEDLGLN